MPKLKRPYITQLMISLEWRLPVSFVTLLCKSGQRASVHVQGDALKVKAFLGEKKGVLQDIQTKPGCSQYTGEFHKQTQTHQSGLSRRCRFSRAMGNGSGLSGTQRTLLEIGPAVHEFHAQRTAWLIITLHKQQEPLRLRRKHGGIMLRLFRRRGNV